MYGSGVSVTPLNFVCQRGTPVYIASPRRPEMAMAFPTTVAELEAVVDRRVQLAMNSGTARAGMDRRVIKGFKSEGFRAALEDHIKPKLRRLELATAESIASVSVKIVEVEAMRAQSDMQLGNSAETIEAMRVAGNKVYRAQSEFDETCRQASGAVLADNTARLAEIQEAMASAMASLNAAAHSKIDCVINQVDGQLRLIRESVAGANQGSGGEGYGGGGPGGGRRVNPKDCKVGSLPDEAKLSDFKHWVAQVEVYRDNTRG